MIPLTTLYDEYIDRSKFTEQKNPFECIVPPFQKGAQKLGEKSPFSDISTTAKYNSDNMTYLKICGRSDAY